MWSLFKRITSIFGFKEEENLSKEEEDELVLTTLSRETIDTFLLGENKKIRSCTGTVTFRSDTVVVIDFKYYLHVKDSLSPDLSVGDFVNFKLYEDKSDVVVKSVQKEAQPNSYSKALPISNFDDWGQADFVKLNGTVTKKVTRNVFVRIEECNLEEITFNLNEVCSEFIPIEGDILLLEGLFVGGKTNNFLVQKISPKKTAVKIGTVSKWEDFHGVISNFAVFSMESCESGYIPVKGDKVLASMIFIENNKGYMWRAIQVVKQYQSIKHISNNLIQDRQDLFANTEGIKISVLPKFTLEISTSIEFFVEVENDSQDDVELLSVSPWPITYHSQISLVNPLEGSITVYPTDKLKFIFKIVAKFIGYSFPEFVWEFTGFKIHRMFKFEVTSTVLSEMGCSEQPTKEFPNKETDVTPMKVLEQSSGTIMPGYKKYSRHCIYPVQLGHHCLPRRVLNAAIPEKPMNFEDILLKVEEVLPCLRKELCPKNYSSRFGALLFLEEAEHLKQVSELSVDGVNFRKSGWFLILDVPRFSGYANKLMSGDKVLASVPWKEDKSMKFEGFIHRVSQTEIWMRFSKEFHYSYQHGAVYSLCFTTSRVAFRRLHQAVSLAKKFLGDQWLFPMGVKTSLPQIRYDEAPLNVDEYVKKSKRPPKINWNRQGSGYGRNCTIDNVYDVVIDPIFISEVKWFNRTLNLEQKEAVINILKGEARPLPYIIFGPPGTGKSVTVVESILHLYNLFPESRVLVATPSNSAADLLTERLLMAGNIEQGHIVRLVGINVLEQGRIVASLIPYTAVLSHRDHEDDEKYFLLNIKNGQVVLAGDPFQLGPYVCSKLATKYGLQESLLSRLLDRFPYKKDYDGFPNSYGYDPRLVTELVNNYRSLPAILELPNMLFYNGHLIPNIADKASEEDILLHKLSQVIHIRTLEGRAPPIIFHGVQGVNSQESNSHSWFNLQEAYQVFVYLNCLYEAGVSPDYVGIITPYQLQVVKIRQMLEQLALEPPKIGSVEEFQGLEKMIIIISVVRSNLDFIGNDLQRALGFVRNPKRLNVAISRARAMLIIIGNPHLLCIDELWKKILKYSVDNNFYTGCDLPVDLK